MLKPSPTSALTVANEATLSKRFFMKMEYYWRMSIAIMAIGVPGSGKTSVLKPLAQKYGLAYISRDELREEMLGDANDQSQNHAIWVESNRRTVEALARGQGVVLDATFAESWKRQDMISFLHEAGASPIIGVFADVPLALAEERNASRKRAVPSSVIEWMYEQLQKEPPTLDEGFDALVPLDEIERNLG